MAETEPNNTPETANVLALNTTTSGSVGSGDIDYFRVVNSTNSDFIQLDVAFNGSGSDTLRMRVFGPNSATAELSNQLTSTGTIDTRYKASYTISNAVAGATYLVSIAKQTADGTKNYTLAATGSDAVITARSKTALKAGETYPIAVTSNKAWSVGDVPEWVTVSPLSGAGNGSVDVTVQANPLGGLARQAQIVIGGATHALTQQENLIVELESNNTPETATALGLYKSATGSVASPDEDYYVFTNNGNTDFIKIDLEFNGSGSDTLRMNVYGPESSTTELANLTTGTGLIETRYKATYTIATPVAGATYYIRIREGTADGTMTYRLTVSAPAAPADSLVISPLSKAVALAGETYPLSVTTQTSWSVTDVPAWVSLSQTSGTGNATIDVSVSANGLGNDERSASLKIGNATHLITQAANPLPAMPRQIISLPGNPTFRLGAANTLSFFYNVSDADATLTGLGIRVHIDSRKIDVAEFANVLTQGLTGIDSSWSADTADHDGNIETDSFVTIAWVDISGNWPGSLPIKLFDLQLTAFNSVTTQDTIHIGFSAISTVPGYVADLPTVELSITNMTLDVDGNGRVEALTDALMIVRRLFGFSGTSLIDRAVATDATFVNAIQIQERLQQMQSILDVDGNGQIDALTDGLLIMRYVFGFRGNVLIANAIGSGAQRTTSSQIEEYLSAFVH